MSFLYIITSLILYILFLMVKKSEKKQSLLVWGVIAVALLLGLEILICVSLSLIGIPYNLSILSLIYILISVIFILKIKNDNSFQKYEVTKYEIILLVFMILLVGYIVIKDRDFDTGAMKYGVTDSAIHYKAAKHFSKYFDLLINIEDKTAYDFNYMQTGAYITDGILMKVINDITGFPEYYIYNIYETFIFMLNGLLFICLIKDFVKDGFSLFISVILIPLYMYGFTYEAYLMGFSYLALGLCFILAILNVLMLYYRKDKFGNNNEKSVLGEKPFKSYWVYIFIGILSFGLIFSYSLYVPVVFSSIVILFFAKGIIEKKKRIFKVIDLETLIIFVVLVIVTIIGASYLLIPTYLNPEIEALGDAIANYGYVPKLLLVDYIYYVPFVIMFIVYSFKYKENIEMVVFLSIAVIFNIVMFWLNSKEMVSDYYLSKVYFYDWILIFYMSIYGISRIKWGVLKNLVPAYTVGIAVLVVVAIIINCNSGIFGTKELGTAGMFYYENCIRRDFIDRRYTFTTDEIELSEHLKEIDDINVDNTLIIAKNNYHIYWVWSIADFKESEDPTNLFVNFAADYKNEKNVENKYEYIIILQNEGNKENYLEDFKVIFENSDAVLMRRK